MSDADLLRRGLVALATLSVVATALELVMLRHWTTALQAIPFVVLGATAAGIVLLALHPTRGRVLAARWIGAAAVVSSLYGVLEHVESNHEAGPLDRVYGATWDTMSALDRWWTAATGGVGPAPPVAPGALAFGALCLLLATARHPALARRAVG